MRWSVCIFIVVAAIVWAASPAPAAQASEKPPHPRAVHVVLIWLKEPGNEQHRQAIIEATRGFSSLPGVEQIRVGPPISSDRASVDDSFDVGLYMTFESTNALKAYLQNPSHREAQRSILGPLVERVIVYDFHDEPH